MQNIGWRGAIMWEPWHRARLSCCLSLRTGLITFIKIDVGQKGMCEKEGHERILTCAPVTNYNCFAFGLFSGSHPHYLHPYMTAQLILGAGLVRGDWRSGQTVICLWLFCTVRSDGHGLKRCITGFFTNITPHFLSFYIHVTDSEFHCFGLLKVEEG